MALVVFIAANLAVGFTFSTSAKNQLHETEEKYGRQEQEERIACSSTANGVSEILPNLWPIGVFLLAAGTVALVRYRERLD